MKIEKEYEESVLKWKEWSTVLNASEKDWNLIRVYDAETIVWLTSVLVTEGLLKTWLGWL